MKTLTVFSLAGLFLLTSCGSKGKDAASMNYDMDEANEVITYYNTSLDVIKKQVDMKDVAEMLGYMEKDGKTRIAPVITRRVVMDKDTTDLLHPGDCFPAAAADSLNRLFQSFLDVTNRLYANYDAYRQYIKSEDYKDDNYARAHEIYAEQQKLAEQVPGLRSELYALLTPYADMAEAATLKDNPLKDHILTGKAIISHMEQVLSLYSETVTKEELQPLYDAIDSDVATAAKLEKKTDFSSEMLSFENMLGRVDKFQGEFRKQLRDGKFTEDGYNSLLSEYNSVISGYNSFVN